MFDQHVKFDKDETILCCDICGCNEYEEQENDSDICKVTESLCKCGHNFNRHEEVRCDVQSCKCEEFLPDMGFDTLEEEGEFLKNEEKEISESISPFVDKFSDDETRKMK